MKVVYIAGPYRAGTEWELEQNIARARAVALKYWRLGYAVICPHSNTHHLSGALDGYRAEDGTPLNDGHWLKGYLEILARCDAIIMMPGWERSAGACAELEAAREARLIVIFDPSGQEDLP